MAAQPALKSQVQSALMITTTEMHTGGEPVRIIESGYPVPQGKTILDKREYLLKNCDQYRKCVMHEPRGHVDMYGVLLVVPDNPEADIAAIFLHNEGYSTMCGHACISLGRYAIDRGLIRRPITFPETQVNIQVPCGLVKLMVQVEQTDTLKTGKVRFESVPSFVVATDVEVEAVGVGTVQVDVVYGGAFYAFVTASDIGVDLDKVNVADVKRFATAIKAATKEKVILHHPETPAFLYGVIVVDSRNSKPTGPATNICIFADAQVDRSPCGSGTSARVALMYHRALLTFGESQTFRSGITGSEFEGRVGKETTVGDIKAVTTEVEGRGYYSGHSTFTSESDDVLGQGFIVK